VLWCNSVDLWKKCRGLHENDGDDDDDDSFVMGDLQTGRQHVVELNGGQVGIDMFPLPSPR